MITDAHGALLDCDYILALAIEEESTHDKALLMRDRLTSMPQFILNITLYELATVASSKFSQAFAKDLVGNIIKPQRPITLLSITDIEQDIWETFFVQNRNKTSFFDCAILTAAKLHRLRIASFDSFYPKRLLV